MQTYFKARVVESPPVTSRAYSQTTPTIPQGSQPITKSGSSFSASLKQLVGKSSPDDMVSEQDLFAAMIGQQLKDQLGDDAYNQYKTALKIGLSGPMPGHSGPSAAYSARQAMEYLVLTGTISQEDSRAIRRFSRDSSQLDDNHRRLYDGFAGPGDDTAAAASLSEVEGLYEEGIANRGAPVLNFSATPVASAGSIGNFINSSNKGSNSGKGGKNNKYNPNEL